MSDAHVAQAIAKERVDGLAKSNAEPEWLKASRLSAWESYLQTPMPTARDEDWRKTEIDSLDLSKFVAVGPIRAKAEGAKKDHALLTSCQAAVGKVAGVFVEDYQNQNLTATIDSALTAQGVVFMTWQEAIEKHPALVEKYLTDKAGEAKPSVKGQDDKFTLMNRALFTGGYILYVPKNVTVEAPFVALVNVTSEKVQTP